MEIALLESDNDYSIGVEFFGRKTRLIVYKRGVEKVCRRETLKRLKDFVHSSDVHLFKGRLQLHKNGQGIAILVNGEIAGTLRYHVFMELIDQSKVD